MSEETQQSLQPTDDAIAELETLRKAHQEVLTKNASRKTKIAELEAANAALHSQLSEASDTIREVTIGVPLKAMSESLSTAPELWIEQFSKHFRIEMKKGQLTLLSADGKPVLKEGVAVPFEREALTELLIGKDSIHGKTFKAITIISRASGAANSTANQRSSRKPDQNKPSIQFGLR
jgi:hypothetical protein